MDPIDRICAKICIFWQAIGQTYDDPWDLLIFGGIVVVAALVLLHRNH
jgi:hypothetical protein